VITLLIDQFSTFSFITFQSPGFMNDLLKWIVICTCFPFRRSNKVQIRNFPNHIGSEEIQELVRSYGPVQKCELGKHFLIQPLSTQPQRLYGEIIPKEVLFVLW